MILLSMEVDASCIALIAPTNREMMYRGEGIRCDDRLQTAYGNSTEKVMIPVCVAGVTDSSPAAGFTAESDAFASFPISRKRLRDSSFFNPNALIVNPDQQQFEFIGEDFASQIYQQQLEIDRFIDRHSEKVRSEIEAMRGRNSIRTAAAYEQIINKLKSKDEQILKIGQLNKSLEEKVKSITVENQIWRELAQTNEATANALRNNLHQLLSNIQLQQQQQQNRHDLESNGDDAESYCGSNFDEDHREVAEEGRGERKVKNVDDGGGGGGYGGLDRRCRRCGEVESCVLLLPCRHLCVCSLCVASVDVCPVCRSRKCAGVHVNMS